LGEVTFQGCYVDCEEYPGQIGQLESPKVLKGQLVGDYANSSDPSYQVAGSPI
jgi:hypothetical protein